jgi:RecA/RadA recombinase
MQTEQIGNKMSKQADKPDIDLLINKSKLAKMDSFDINKIVDIAKSSYAKGDRGLASQLTTGSDLVRPKSDDDFVLWTFGDTWSKGVGLRGLPFGRLVQIAGKVDSGKSTHALLFALAAQQQGTVVIYWDSERKFAATRFQKMGGDPAKLLMVDTNNIVNGCKAVAQMVHATKEAYPKAKILIVWDSVGASISSVEDKEDTEDINMQPGVTAKEVSWAVRKFNKLINKYFDRENGKETIAALAINQTYVSIGGYGAPTQIERGGTELGYLSSVIVQLSRKQDLTRTKDGDKYKYGIVSKMKVRKNHLHDQETNLDSVDIVVSADGIYLASDIKSFDDIQGWDDKDGDE